MKPVLGAFVVYCACGKSITGAQLDFGPDNDDDDGGMLLDGLRAGRKLEYVKGEENSHVSLGKVNGCECSGMGKRDE